MSYLSDFEDSVYDVLAAMYPNYEILWEPTNAPAVKSPFIGLQVNQMSQVGRFFRSTLADSNGQIEIVAQFECPVSVSFYGRETVKNVATAREAGDAAADFYFDIANASDELLSANRLSFIRISPFIPFRLFHETDWYTAHRTTLVLGFAVRSVVDVDTIETVGFSGSFTHPDNSSISVDSQTTNP